jgi:photosystem II stability/assembly factor-like uncharacterized protein
MKSPEPVLLSQVGYSEVLYVLWSQNCANDKRCYALERSDNGGQTFTRVNAPPVEFGPTNQNGPLYELDFANASDGLAVVQSANSLTTLYATFNGGASWQRDFIRTDQRINSVASTSTTFYAVTSYCPDPNANCTLGQLNSSPASSTDWTAHGLPIGLKHFSALPNVAAFGRDVWLTTQEQAKPYTTFLATSYNEGETFAIRSTPMLSSVVACGLTATSTVTLWAQCDQGMMSGDIVVSYDGGHTWSYGHGGIGQFGFGTFDPISTFAAVYINYMDGDTLHAIQFLPTGLSNAETLGKPPSTNITQLTFVSPLQGLALGHGNGVGDFATLYETSDGGKRWRTSSLVK